MNKFSNYLKKKKNVLKKLIEELMKDYSFASVLVTDVSGKNYAIDRKSTYVLPSPINECGFVVRVYKDGLYSEYSFNEIDDKTISNYSNTKSDCVLFVKISVKILSIPLFLVIFIKVVLILKSTFSTPPFF